jgi:hypothetical protein
MLSLLLILYVSAEIILHIRGGQKALNFPMQKMMSQQQQRLIWQSGLDHWMLEQLTFDKL